MTYFLRRILFVYFRPYWKQCVPLFLCIVITISFDTIFPLSVKFLINLAIIASMELVAGSHNDAFNLTSNLQTVCKELKHLSYDDQSSV